MRRVFHQLVPLTALMLILAACGDDADTSADGDASAAEDADGDAGDGDADADDGDGDGDSDGGDDGDDGADGDQEEGEGSAVLTWDGETYEYAGASCRASSRIERFQMRALDGDADHPQLDIRFELLDDEQADYSRATDVAIFFNHGATIGEGEGYEARGDDARVIDADESGASGELTLGPDSHSMADEVNPEGGTLEFELVCP